MHPAFRLMHPSAALFATSVLAVVASAQITFTEVAGISFPYAVSADATVLAGAYGGVPTRWTASSGGVSLSGTRGLARAISADGSVVAGAIGTNPFDEQPFKWTQAGGFGTLPVPAGLYDGKVYGLSADGMIAVGSVTHPSPGGYVEAVRWNGNTPVLLGELAPGTGSAAYAISADGSTIVGNASGPNSGPSHAVRWTNGGPIEDLGTMGGYNAAALGISADGTAIIGWGSPMGGGTDGFVWTEAGGAVRLAVPQRAVVPQAVAPHGSMVIGYTAKITQWGEGFVWTPTSGVRDFLDVARHEYGLGGQLGSWSELFPLAMSPDGRYLAGYGLSNRGGSAWLMDLGLNPPELGPSPFRPVPEAATFAWFGAALLLAAISLRRRVARRC